MNSHSLHHRPLAFALLVTSSLVLGGCAATQAGGAPVSASGPATATAPGAAGFPITVDNCGTEVTFTQPPERVITVKSTATEMLLALGLEERVIGTAFADGSVPDAWAGRASGLTTLSDTVPSQEVVLEQEPDLVYAGWESNFSADGAGDRATLREFGVNTYVSPSACKEEAYQPKKLSFDDVFAEITEVGALFGVPDAAAREVAEQKDKLASVSPAAGAPTALWYSSGSDTPYVGAGIGAPEMIMEAVGLTNIADGIGDTWSSLGWESVVEFDPDVIVLVDSTWNSAQKKRAYLESNPATAALSAVKNQRYLTVPFPAGEAGVRNTEAVLDLSAQLTALAVH